jgi:hypothetical protein
MRAEQLRQTCMGCGFGAVFCDARDSRWASSREFMLGSSQKIIQGNVEVASAFSKVHDPAEQAE